MDRCGVDYLAPADARKLDLEHASVDLQVSFTVFEHIAPDILLDILRETARVLRPEGLALNLVDYSDHFSHRDASLHRLNFLRYSDTEWTRIAGNRFHYLNRLRHDDMLSLHAKAGLSLVSEHPLRIPALLDSAPPLDPSYRNKPAEILSTLGAWIAARPNSATPAKPFTTF
jgi:SAM-dependent methyltransferase